MKPIFLKNFELKKEFFMDYINDFTLNPELEFLLIEKKNREKHGFSPIENLLTTFLQNIFHIFLWNQSGQQQNRPKRCE